jgi:Type I restriction enzyme R protein N terminus (HSDR_N)
MPSLESLSRYRFAGKSERAVREEWIRPLLEHLGYGIDTLHDLRYEERLTLAQPLRRIGSTTISVDYVPTVLGHGLWIIEAKAPEARDTWDEAVGQAWTYATHPEVDVPLMAIADGTRITVFDVTKPDWNAPVVDVLAGELAGRFSDLFDEMGAPNVATRIRSRQLRHLGAAMRAELDPLRLEETVAAVRDAANQARPVVIANRANVLRDQFRREQQQHDQVVLSVGVWGLAQHHNQPISESLGDVRLAADYVRSLPELLRGRELDNFVEATRRRVTSTGQQLAEPGPPRMFWMLRIIALGTYLELLDDPGCGEQARELARQAIRNHILNFPNNDVARAAHRLERILPPFLLRRALATEDIDLSSAARAVTSLLGDEARLRRRPDADRMLLQLVSLQSRMVFAQINWTTENLNETAAGLERVVPTIAYRTDRGQGQAHDPFMTFYLEVDQLMLATLDVIGPGRTEVLDPEMLVWIRDAAEHDDPSISRWAARVLSDDHAVAAGSPPPLQMPARFTEKWIAANVGRLHPGQIPTLIDEMRRRGWANAEIHRRLAPYLSEGAE